MPIWLARTSKGGPLGGPDASTRSPEPLDGVESGPTGRFPSMAEPSDTPFETMSGIPVEGVYGPDDAERPGTYPYTRGPYASMYRSKVWTMRMFAGFGTAIDTNARFKDLLANGGDGLSTAFDLPTLMGRDSDDELSLGEVVEHGALLADRRGELANLLPADQVGLGVGVLLADELRVQSHAHAFRERSSMALSLVRRLTTAVTLCDRNGQRVSLCSVCFLQVGQNFFSSMRSGSLRRFLRVM